jgi:hypothetical protein
MAGGTNGGWDALDPTYNELTGGGVTPTSGFSIAAMATGAGKRFVTASGSNAPGAGVGGPQGAAANAVPSGNLFVGLAVFIVLLLAIMFTAHRVGDEGEFSNIKATAYNCLLISLVALAGIPIWKMATMTLVSWNVPLADHLNSWAQAA